MSNFDLTIILSLISVIGTISSILFAYLAFSRNKNNDNNESIIDLTTIKLNGEYTKDAVKRIENRLDETDRQTLKNNERLTRLEERMTNLEDHVLCK